jgi:hypothetical protein
VRHLHRGHVSYLAQATALGARVEQRRLGTPGCQGPRPLSAELNRTGVLAALESIGIVTLLDKATPIELVRRVLAANAAFAGEPFPLPGLYQRPGGGLCRSKSQRLRVQSDRRRC